MTVGMVPRAFHPRQGRVLVASHCKVLLVLGIRLTGYCVSPERCDGHELLSLVVSGYQAAIAQIC